MKQTLKALTALTVFMLLPAFVENTAQLDAIGPVIGLTLLLAAVAAGIFALPVRNRKW